MEGSESDINIFNARSTNSSSIASNANNNTQEFEKERKTVPTFDPSALYYDMSGDKFLIIFNHFEYQKTRYFNYQRPSRRKGTHEDVISLKDLAKKLGFKVLTYTDLEHGQIIDCISQISSDDHTRTSLLMFVIMTHGEKGGELFAADRPYQFKDLTSMLEAGHPSLVNKPKLFFVQACRGGKTDEGRTVELDGGDNDTLVVPSHVDFLVMYSTVEDYLSWRDAGGSWLIQELCEVIASYHKDLDLLQMITLINRNVAYKRSSNTPLNVKTHRKKQTPETRFTLTKLLKL